MLVVIAIMAVVAGGVVWLSGGARGAAEEKAIQAELATIRKACLQFKADMGEPPQYLAELMQSPDPADSPGGWWWREPSSRPDARLCKFDPATGRGWNGPYIKAEFVSTDTDADAGDDPDRATELRLETAASYVPSGHTSPPVVSSVGKRLAILVSDFQGGQKRYPGDARRLLSHYQLDLTRSDETFVRFVEYDQGSDPLAPASARKVAGLGLGFKVTP